MTVGPKVLVDQGVGSYLRPMTRLLFLLAILCVRPVLVAAQQTSSPASDDPFVWLEDVESARSMEWVNAKNAATLAALTRPPLYQTLFDRIKQNLDSKDKIAYPQIMGDALYNFWQDADHERGIWRRTTWASYATANPSWETVIDLDSLSKAEGVMWSWQGANCLEPEYKRCIVALSRGGSDASERREFDVTTKQFVAGGFRVPEAKTSTTWGDDNTLPGPESVPTGSVLSSTRVVLVFASGIRPPPATNCLVVTSNSRRSLASDPPRESATMQRLYAGSRQFAPCHDHITPSALLRESRSMTVSHEGLAVA